MRATYVLASAMKLQANQDPEAWRKRERISVVFHAPRNDLTANPIKAAPIANRRIRKPQDRLVRASPGRQAWLFRSPVRAGTRIAPVQPGPTSAMSSNQKTILADPTYRYEDLIIPQDRLSMETGPHATGNAPRRPQPLGWSGEAGEKASIV